MANADRPNGFRFVKGRNGSSTPVIRSVGVADAADIFVGDALQLSSGLAQKLAVEGECLGVAVGFGKKGTMNQEFSGPFNPDNLMSLYYDDSASTHTDWVVYYIPAEDNIFAVQTAAAETLTVGLIKDLVDGGGDTTTGISQMEIASGAATNDGDLMVVEIPNRVDNDVTLANAEYWVVFVDTQFSAPIA
jgi:hypothetical protein